ncbi:MAG: hypothetical protein K2N74_02580, partial [Clostridiales bacterium]|nr:hypothetical protein [Clostridiales bacterium]
PGDPSDPNDPPVTVPDTHYTVAVYYNNKPFEPGELDITVVWRSNSSATRQPLNAEGKADAGELDGDYNVYLMGLPDTYTYNPNGYKAPDENGSKQIQILLTSVQEPASGDGSNMYGNRGCYQTRLEGTYRAVLKNEKQVLFYEFTPSAAGVYIVESWANVYDDELCPKIDVYGGTSANKWFVRTLEGGGAALEGGFSKNFRWEIAVDQSEIGNAFTFAVHAVSKSGQYPVYVDFSIKRIGKYTNEYADIRPQAAKDIKGKTEEPEAGKTFVFADLGTQVFNASKFKKSPNTGRYHLYDMDLYADNPYGGGIGYGPILYCAITKSIESYTVIGSLYTANVVGVNRSNYLMLYNSWIEAEQKFATFDYTNFIRSDYYRICNSDGVCYVTDELKAFLQKFAVNHSLYTDAVGPGEGTPEYNGYTANQDSLWLFACGIYQ